MKRKVLTALLSLVAAFSLWLYVVTVVNTELEDTFENIPVVLQGESFLTDRGLMITDGHDSTVTVSVFGNRNYISRLNKGNITVIADVSNVNETGSQTLYYDVRFPGDIPSNAVSVQSQNPDLVTIYVEERITKPIPVNIQYIGSLASDYIIDKATSGLDVTQINITGPKSVIDQISQAVIEVDLAGRTESFSESYRATLCSQDGTPVDVAMVETDVEDVRLELKIRKQKDLKLTVTVVAGGGATEKNSEIKIDPATIRISGSATALDKLTEYNLGTINLGELTKDTTKTFPITLPEGITNETGITEASVTVRFPNLLTKEITVTSITPQNVPAGMVPEIVTKAVNVTVRGPKDLVTVMAAADVSLTVDFANVAAGTSTINAEVKIGSTFAEVGYVGTYSVSVTLLTEEEAAAKATEEG